MIIIEIDKVYVNVATVEYLSLKFATKAYNINVFSCKYMMYSNVYTTTPCHIPKYTNILFINGDLTFV